MIYGQTNREEPPGTGAEDDPYLVSSPAHLSWITQNYTSWNKYFVQTVDIDLSETATWDDSDDNNDGDKYNDPNDMTTEGKNDGWLPIENFSGVYDGDDHVIDRLSIINRVTSSGYGFFKIINGAKVTNLGLTNLNIYGSEYIGGIAGTIKEGLIENCFTTGEITCTGDEKYRFGGIAGFINSGIIEIANSYSKVNINGNGLNNYAGGFVGNIKGVVDGSIENCYATGNLDSCGAGVGGFVGKIEDPDFSISNCHSTGNVSSEFNEVGGFAGANFDALISQCFSTGNVSSKYKKVGGFVGVNTLYKFSGGVIEDCYSLGNVTRKSGSYLNFGGFCGINSASEIKNSYAIGSVFFQDTLIYDKGFVGSHVKGDTVIACFFDSTVSNQVSSKLALALSTEEMQSGSVYINAGWDFSAIWEITDDKYPTLRKTVVSIEENKVVKTISTEYILKQNYPNPFNPTTKIDFAIPKSGQVKIVIYDMQGREVAQAVNGYYQRGSYSYVWEAKDKNGLVLPSGLYIAKIQSGSFVGSIKMLLLK
jgi:hypothetical protein